MLSTLLVSLGWVITPFWGMNKQLWSPSYLFFMAGACGYLLVGLYIVYDLDTFLHYNRKNGWTDSSANPMPPPWWQHTLRIGFEPMRWVGMNTIFIYVWAPSCQMFGNVQQWLYFNGDPHQNLRFVHTVHCLHCLHCLLCLDYCSPGLIQYLLRG